MNILHIILGLVPMAFAHGFENPELDEEVHLDERIIGGKQVSITDYPYQLSIRRGDVNVCAAVLISTEWAATSAKSVDAFKSTPTELIVRAGSIRQISGGVTVTVEKIIHHPRFTKSPLDYDLALLKLKPKLNVTANIRPVKLPEAYWGLPAGQKALVSGWGASKTQNQTNVLNAGQVHISEPATCKKYYPTLVTERMFCAASFGGYQGACEGDNGGPLVSSNYLYGIHSYSEGCGLDQHPPVYVNVLAVRDFIDDTISSNE